MSLDHAEPTISIPSVSSESIHETLASSTGSGDSESADTTLTQAPRIRRLETGATISSNNNCASTSNMGQGPSLPSPPASPTPSSSSISSFPSGIASEEYLSSLAISSTFSSPHHGPRTRLNSQSNSADQSQSERERARERDRGRRRRRERSLHRRAILEHIDLSFHFPSLAATGSSSVFSLPLLDHPSHPLVSASGSTRESRSASGMGHDLVIPELELPKSLTSSLRTLGRASIDGATRLLIVTRRGTKDGKQIVEGLMKCFDDGDEAGTSAWEEWEEEVDGVCARVHVRVHSTGEIWIGHLECKNYDEKIIQKILKLIHKPFEMVLPLLNPIQPASPEMKNLLMNPSIPFYNTVIIQTSTPGTRTEHDLINALTPIIHTIPVDTTCTTDDSSTDPDREAIPTPYIRGDRILRQHALGKLGTTLRLNDPTVVRELREHAVEGFLRWRDMRALKEQLDIGPLLNKSGFSTSTPNSRVDASTSDVPSGFDLDRWFASTAHTDPLNIPAIIYLTWSVLGAFGERLIGRNTWMRIKWGVVGFGLGFGACALGVGLGMRSSLEG
ncbi:hypothetical protein SISNIDRAFT_552882 [Sistotremastrum niveocremeum HHB9708]|uniref:Uncharacterized protein n=1 Tax=Sistotremastrum niveocremeum HHB9708 TaxID=1314777 RepID=A0A164NU93_9AGAM|nr:hypothetical protein SISNIDRAFT_552882 [Sistotremastrum niveocremeum HHB9708]